MISFGSKNTRQMGRGRCPSEEASRFSHPHRAPRCPADTRVARYGAPSCESFVTTPQFWITMQVSFDLAAEAASIKDEIATIENYAEARLAA